MSESKRPRLADSVARSTYGRSNSPGDELISYMAARGSKIKGLEEEVTSLTAENQQLKSQLQDKGYKLEKAESELKVWTVVKQSEADGAAATVQQLEQLLQREMAKSHQLSLQLDQKQQQLETSQQQTRTTTEQLLAAQSGNSDAVEALENQIRSLKQQLQSSSNEQQEQLHQYKLAYRTEKAKRESVAATNAALQEQLETVRQNIRSLQHAKSNLELQLVEAQTAAANAAAAPGAAAGADADTHFLISTLQRELKQQEAEIEEARRIKRHMENIEILRDQLRSAKLRAVTADAAVSEANELRLHAERLQKELDQWHQLFQPAEGSAGTGRPDPQAIAQLQQDALNSRQALSQKDAEIKRLNQQVKELQEAKEKLEREAADARSSSANASKLLAIAEKRLGLLGRERDSLKKILDVMEQEPMSVAGASSEAQLQDALAKLQQQRERCRMLEEKQQDLEASVEEMQRAMSELSASEREQRQLAQAAAVRVDSITELNRQLEKEVTDLGNEVTVLQSRLGAGDYNRSTTKVLHLIRNPEAEYQRMTQGMRVEQLEAENQALRDNISRLEQQAEQGGAAGGSLSLAVKDAEITVARRRASELEKQVDRLKAVFKDRIGVFREACALLFGYRVDMTSEAASSSHPDAATTYISLHPLMESRSSEAVLQFRLSKAKGIRLIPTAYSETLKRQVDTFLSKYKSVPAFTANITMELFSQATQG